MNKKLKITSSVTLVAITLLVIAIAAFINLHRHVLTNRGPSMQPTIANGQSIVWKAYAANVSTKVNDVILYNKDGLQQYNHQNGIPLIDRVVGVAGDRVVIANNTLTIFDTAHPDGYNPDSHAKTVTATHNVNVTLQAGQLYVLGDNTAVSLDSRTFGPIGSSSVKGYVDLHSSLAKYLNQQN